MNLVLNQHVGATCYALCAHLGTRFDTRLRPQSTQKSNGEHKSISCVVTRFIFGKFHGPPPFRCPHQFWLANGRN